MITQSIRRRTNCDSANRLLSAGGQSFEYDTSGNMTKASSLGESTDYTYDGNNRLISVNFSNETYASYSYDGLDRLVRRETSNYDPKILEGYNDSVAVYNDAAESFNKTASENNGKTEKENNGKSDEKSNNGKSNNGKSKEKDIPKGLIGNENANANAYKKYELNIEEPNLPKQDVESERFDYLGTSTLQHKIYSDSGSPMNEYYHANGEVVAQKMFGLKGRITPGQEETIKTNGGLMYYEYDGLGSVTTLRNKQGDKIEDYRYDVFGNIQTGITSPYNMTGYTSQMYDDKSSLVYMNSRWYNPNVGRFMNEDTWKGTLSNPQTQNKYAYVLNNPVNYTDPSGNVPEWVKNRSNHSYKTHDTGDSYMGHKYVYKGESSSGGSWDLNSTRTYETYIEKSYSRSTTTTINYKYYKTGNTYNEEYGWSSIVLDAVNVEYKVSGSQSKTERVYADEIAAENQKSIEKSVGEIDLEWNETEKSKHDYSQDASTLTLEMIEGSYSMDVARERVDNDISQNSGTNMSRIKSEEYKGKVNHLGFGIRVQNVVSVSYNTSYYNESDISVNFGNEGSLDSVGLDIGNIVGLPNAPQIVISGEKINANGTISQVDIVKTENVIVSSNVEFTQGIDITEGPYIGLVKSTKTSIRSDSGKFEVGSEIGNETRLYPGKLPIIPAKSPVIVSPLNNSTEVDFWSSTKKALVTASRKLEEGIERNMPYIGGALVGGVVVTLMVNSGSSPYVNMKQ